MNVVCSAAKHREVVGGIRNETASHDPITSMVRRKASCAEVRKIAKHHLDDIRAKINDLVKLERLLARTIARCSGKSVPDCPILDILDVERTKRQANRE
jgi:hypothetical protein